MPTVFEPHQEWAVENFCTRFPSRGRLLSRRSLLHNDPHITEVDSLWPKESNGKAKKLGELNHPEQLQHKNLFWLYRNALVHNFQSPGRAWERRTHSEKSPYYCQLSTVTGISNNNCLQFTNQWELAYPVEFFESLTRESLHSAASYHANAATSPFSARLSETYWLPGFNEYSD